MSLSRERTDRVRGVMLGFAAGDRNGRPTRMALRLPQSFVENKEFDIEDLGRRYLDWCREGPFDTGPVAAEVLRLVDSGVSWHEATREVYRRMNRRTAGCNHDHRVPPLARVRFFS